MNNLTFLDDIEEISRVLSGTGFGREVSNYTKGRKPYSKDVFRWIKGLVSSDADILDMACGNGNATIDLREYVTSKVTGFDIDKDMLTEAKRRSKERNFSDIQYVQGDACTMEDDHPFKSGRFDAICIFSAIHWLLKPKALQAFHAILKPKGKLIIVDGEIDNDKEEYAAKNFRETFTSIISRILNRPIIYEKQNGTTLLKNSHFKRLAAMAIPYDVTLSFADYCSTVKSCSFYAELSNDEKEKVWPALEMKVKESFTTGLDAPTRSKETHKCFVYKPVQ